MPPKNIQEIYSMREILSQIHFNTVILYDIDNTLIQSPLELGSDQWFVMMCTEALKKIPDPLIATSLAIALYHEVQLLIKAHPIEDITIKLFKTLKDIGIPMIAVTARAHCLKKATQRQLQDIGINFATDKILLRPFSYAYDQHPIYDNGIIYCAGQDKGKALGWFLDKSNLNPEHIIMVDDKEKHLLHVKDVVEDRGVSFHGFRYSHLDEKVKQLDMDAAHHQYQFIKPRLPESLVSELEVLNLKPTKDRHTSSQYGHFFYGKVNHNLEVSQSSALLKSKL